MKITNGAGTGFTPARILLVSSGSNTEAIVLQALFLLVLVFCLYIEF